MINGGIYRRTTRLLTAPPAASRLVSLGHDPDDAAPAPSGVGQRVAVVAVAVALGRGEVQLHVLRLAGREGVVQGAVRLVVHLQM